MGPWRVGKSWSFLTERARARAPQVVDYASAPGGALLVAPNGDIVIRGGVAIDVDVVRIARMVCRLATSRDVLTFAHEGICVHAVTVSDGWRLCVLSTTGVAPALVVERAKRAAHVLALALADGGRSSTPGRGGASGAPAEARVDAHSRKN